MTTMIGTTAICLCAASVVIRKVLSRARLDWEFNAFELGRDYERMSSVGD